MRFPYITVVLCGALIAAAGCGTTSVSSNDRVTSCLKQQPEATKADCRGWERAGQLHDDGTHEGHDKMQMGG